MMMAEIMVREATPTDVVQLCDLNLTALGYEFSLDSTAERIAYVLKKPGNKIFVAEYDGIVAGYLHAEDYDTLYCEPLKNILGLAVSGAYRRCGIGRTLINACEEWAAATGAAGVRLTSGMSRTGAHKFYEACGYVSWKDSKNFFKFIVGE
ncbi:MAG: GNAT family N-acetyltransferase [Oscillospiraceae bacterium]